MYDQLIMDNFKAQIYSDEYEHKTYFTKPLS